MKKEFLTLKGAFAAGSCVLKNEKRPQLMKREEDFFKGKWSGPSLRLHNARILSSAYRLP